MQELPFPRPAFTVGITGHMRFTEHTRGELEQRLRAFFSWLRSAEVVTGMHPHMKGLGLSPATPVQVLTCMAPGADDLMREVANAMASDWRSKGFGELSVYGMLPLMRDAYAEATTYSDAEERTNAAKHAMLGLAKDAYQVVRLKDHERMEPDELRAHHLVIARSDGDKERMERHRCYQAAGERVAAYSHILIAITDDVNDDPAKEVEPGSKRILNVQLRGLTPDLTSGSSAHSFGDIGPVFWLKAFADKDAEEPRFRFLDPSKDPDKDGHRLPQDRLRPTGERALRAIANALDRYNNEPLAVRTLSKAKSEAKEALTVAKDQCCISTPYEQAPALKQEHQAAVDRIGLARRVAADLSAQYAAQIGRLDWWMHGLAFTAIALLGAWENWRPRDAQGDDLELPTLYATGLVLSALVASLIGYALYVWTIQRHHSDQRKDDYRAIAEGLRAQFYWTACGMAETVASFYLLRQRDALSWLRYAMRSVSMPFMAARDAFDELLPAKKIELFQRTLECWFNVQYCYFRGKVATLKVSMERIHQRGSVFLFTGLWLLVLVFLMYGWGLEENIVTGVRSCGWTLLAGTITVLFGIWLAFLEYQRRKRSDLSQRNSDDEGSEHDHPEHPALELAGIIGRSILLTIILLVLLSRSSALSFLPSIHHLTSYASTLAFALGGLSHLYIGKTFMREDLRRYDAMRALYGTARERMRWELGVMDRTKDTDAELFAKHLSQAQDLLRSVGREAIQENTEWLTNHRDRPIEPVMPH